ncbi:MULTISPECIES: DEAD/DEAH box helicase [unclassified Amycolatopsis]|uniref:DEAD/DEAH box helicase n=1 Tax=unclassified Amycolatopsis TaxID=2618356 RepID=UPI002874A3BD|nr:MULTISPECIES: DEAD/DEAH box helicase [unclassified Amycolatopsis]MDS0136129.1 DEAD/DEAH box helicase [Amycolatopsis sp. 505]MDS0145282.1 DEAD/DEAH box helicase [Amycolatopsis sp. CM201R]
MPLVHALWSPGRGLLLWAERDGGPAGTSSRSARIALPHPFAVSGAHLTALHPGKPASATVLLPSRANRPLASSEPAADGRRRGPAPSLRPWSVPALIVDAAELDDLDDSASYGASVTHLRAVAHLAADLVRRGRVLPTLVRQGDAAEARWRPVLQGVDFVAFDALVAAMPPVGRAEQIAPLTGASPRALVTDALHTLVDAAVRDRLARADPPVDLAGGRGVTGVWLSALQGGAPRVELPLDELGVLADAVAKWDEVADTDVVDGRACFRLAEVGTLRQPDADDPDDQTGDGTKWQLQFLLRATADPSLLLSAGQIWSGEAHGLVRDPKGLLVAELGRAALVAPMLAPALRRTRPSEYDLSFEEAEQFLISEANRLVEAGFEVQLPAAWDGRRRLGLRLSVRSTPSEQVVARVGRDELAAFRWSVAVGDDEIGEEELARLVAAKSSLVRLRGRWISVDADRLRAGLEFLRRDPHRSTPRPTAADLLELVHPGRETPLPVTDVRAGGWVGDVLSGRVQEALRPVELPSSFRATLRPYQQRGVAWLAFMSALGLGACLADDMGLGKTVQTLALEAVERARGDRRPTLVLCPMSLVGMWQREAANFAPDLRVHAHHGSARAHGDALAAQVAAADLVVTTYATATRDAGELAKFGWRRLVLDEAHAIKNADTATAKAVRRFPAGHRLALTGTPVENRLADLWSVLDLLNPGLLGSRFEFRQRFAAPIERTGDTATAAALRRITQPYLLRRVKTDPVIVPELPEKIEIRQEYRLTREQGTLYSAIVDEMMTKIQHSQGIKRRGNILAAITKLKQVCNHPAHLLHDGSPLGDRSGKVSRLQEVLAEILASGDRALCFTQYTEFGHLLVPHLADRLGTEVGFLHGGLAKGARDAIVDRFQSGDGPRVLVLSLKAGGSGLTLTAAGQVLHLDRWWNPAVENQATDRAFRIGQHRTVQVRKFICPGTIEDRIDTLIDQKRALAGLVVGEGDSRLTELSTDALRGVLALGEEAIDD